jgi:basic membrane protein A and related proteins
MHATFLYVGVLADLGWSYVHDQGRLEAMKRLPWLTTDFVTNVISDNDIAKHANDAIERGSDVIVHTAQGGSATMRSLAATNPNVAFLQLYDNAVTGPNLGAYWLRIQQSWYIAGYVAARKSKTHRIAWIGGYVSPQGVVRANAYLRGAQRADPNIKVEVRWVGFWFDPGNPIRGKYRETLLAEQSLQSGADVIIANTDNERVYDVVEEARKQGKDVWSIQTNNRASCARYPRSCLGVAWLDWTSIYVDQLDAMHRRQWTPSYVHPNIDVDTTRSTVGFQPSDSNLTETDTRLELDLLLARLVADKDFALRGPYETTGQRAPVASDDFISDEELLQMCWFAKGMVERVDPNDPRSPDRDATVPIGDRAFLDIANLSPEAAGLATPPDCRKNL